MKYFVLALLLASCASTGGQYVTYKGQRCQVIGREHSRTHGDMLHIVVTTS
jgi:hypothetical protein